MDKGVIKAEAVRKCGGGDYGEKALTLAVEKGEVKIKCNKQGIELYHFPFEKFGMTETASRVNRSERGKNITNEAHNAISQLVDTLGWSIGASDRQLQAGK